MTKVNSFYGAYIILKESLQFLWHNMRIVPAVLFFSGITYLLMGGAYMLLLTFLKTTSFEGMLEQLVNTVPTIKLLGDTMGGWGGVFVAGILLAPAAVIIWLLSAFVPGVSETTYILSALRTQPMSFGESFSQGFKRCLRAWHIFIGIIFIAGLLLVIPLAAMKLISLMALYEDYLVFALVAAFFLLYTLLFLVKFYFWQLIADGHYSFNMVIKQSIHYLKKSWIALIAAALYFSLITQIIEKLLFLLLLPTALISSPGVGIIISKFVIRAVMGLIFAPLWAVIINKIYLAVRED
jgi:hypothetical protein